MAYKAKFGIKKREKGINVTPFVDVLLVVLVIFILTSNASIPGIEVNLPKASNSTALEKPKTKAITIDPSGATARRIGAREETSDREVSLCVPHFCLPVTRPIWFSSMRRSRSSTSTTLAYCTLASPRTITGKSGDRAFSVRRRSSSSGSVTG